MTRKEAIEILKPERINESCTAGVFGCPCGKVSYRGLNFYFDMQTCSFCCGDCTRCWNEKLSIKESANLLSVVGDDVIRAYLRKKRNEPVQK